MSSNDEGERSTRASTSSFSAVSLNGNIIKYATMSSLDAFKKRSIVANQPKATTVEYISKSACISKLC